MGAFPNEKLFVVPAFVAGAPNPNALGPDDVFPKIEPPAGVVEVLAPSPKPKLAAVVGAGVVLEGANENTGLAVTGVEDVVVGVVNENAALGSSGFVVVGAPNGLGLAVDPAPKAPLEPKGEAVGVVLAKAEVEEVLFPNPVNADGVPAGVVDGVVVDVFEPKGLAAPNAVDAFPAGVALDAPVDVVELNGLEAPNTDVLAAGVVVGVFTPNGLGALDAGAEGVVDAGPKLNLGVLVAPPTAGVGVVLAFDVSPGLLKLKGDVEAPVPSAPLREEDAGAVVAGTGTEAGAVGLLNPKLNFGPEVGAAAAGGVVVFWGAPKLPKDVFGVSVVTGLAKKAEEACGG